MQVADVNVLIYAHRPESPHHDATRRWLTAALDGDEPFGVSELVLSGFVRIVTHHRVYREPSPLRTALEFCESVLAAPAAIAVRPGPRHWSIFAELCRRVSARGIVVPDAFHAALAIEQGATWISTDRAFARFPGLHWRYLPEITDADQR